MRYDVYQIDEIFGFQHVGQVDAASDSAALTAATNKWKGGVLLTREGVPLSVWPPIGLGKAGVGQTS
jgi:hypothetical protein